MVEHIGAGNQPEENAVALGYGRRGIPMQGRDEVVDGRLPVDLQRLVDFYMRGLLDLDTIIAERIPLEQINDGFEKMKQGTSARSVVVFD